MAMLEWNCTEHGRGMAALTLWSSGQSLEFTDYQDFRSHTFRVADESEGMEVTIFDDEPDPRPVAYMYFLSSTSWHRKTPGLDVSVLVIRPDAQSSRKVLETVRAIIESVCKEEGLSWYSRVKHVNQTTDIVVTKEINRG